MSQHRLSKGHWFLAAVLGLALQAAVLAEDTDWGSVQEIPEIPPRFLQQPYLPDPPAETPPKPSPAPKKRSLLSRILGRPSLPIMQPQKVNVEFGKETLVVADPLIRLTKPVMYQGTVLTPGFYLVQLQTAPNGQGTALQVMRQQQVLLTVPATTLAGTTSLAMTTVPQTASPSQNTQGKAKDNAKGKTPASASPKQETVTAQVHVAENAQTVVLVYQKGSQQYVSLPLAISP